MARRGAEEAVTVYDQGGLKISGFLNHDPVEPAYGYRIEYGGRAVVVSGDTAPVQNMARFAKGADVLVHEALNKDMVEMLAGALDQTGNTRGHHGAAGGGLSHEPGGRGGHREGRRAFRISC